MKTILLYPLVGSFAEDKDVAREVRVKQIFPALEEGEEVILDFTGIESATQSFIHALISDIMRKHEDEFFELLQFKGCNETIKKIINIVVDYMLERD